MNGLFENLSKNRRELTFIGAAILLLVVLGFITVVSLRFLVKAVTEAVDVSAIQRQQPILHFNLGEAEKLNLK